MSTSRCIRLLVLCLVLLGGWNRPRIGGAAETGATLTGTTVIVHGFQLSATVPDWTYYLAEAIRTRAGGGRVLEVDQGTGELVDCTHPACGPPGGDGETIIVFDWAADSAESGTGFSEAAAEALVASLVLGSGADPRLVELDHLHLIGHSRGAVVVSETAERLIAAGLPAPEQVTSLDPHDTGAFGLTDEHDEPEGLWDDLDVNELHPDYECSLQPGEISGVCAWESVGYHDNYWRDQDDLPCLFDPDGKVIPGAADFDASGLDAFCHSDVHAWYHFTVDTVTPTHPVTGDPPGIDWFDPAATTCSSSSRTSPLARTVDGYNTSRVGGSPVRCPDDPASRQRVGFDFNLAEGLVNGDFEKEPAGATPAGWQYHGGGGGAVLADDGDRYLRLEAGQWRRHGRFLVPRDALGIRFCRTVLVPGAGDELTITLHQAHGSRTLFDENPTAVSGWQCVEVAIQQDEIGAPGTLEIAVNDDGVPPTARFGVDDLSLRVGLFMDDFESGDTSRWSAVHP